MESPIYVGVNALVVRDSKILLGKRLNITGSGFWGVPGGHLEPGESIYTAVKRELEEEMGIIATKYELANVINQPRPEGDRHYVQFNFIVTELTGEPVNREPSVCEAVEWFDLDKLPENLFFAHKNFVRHWQSGKLFIDKDE